MNTVVRWGDERRHALEAQLMDGAIIGCDLAKGDDRTAVWPLVVYIHPSQLESARELFGGQLPDNIMVLEKIADPQVKEPPPYVAPPKRAQWKRERGAWFNR
jgi:hypothetical protein